jgi:hypothetical protein
MTTFHPRQSERGRCVHRKADTSTLQIHFTNCTTKLHGNFHEARKIWCNHFQRALQEHLNEWSFYTKEALPLSRAKVLRLANGSPELARSPARWSRDDREPSGNKSGEMSRATAAQCPRNERAPAEALSPDSRREDSQDNLHRAEFGCAMSAPETCKTTCNLSTQRRRNNRATVHATSRKQLMGFSPPAFNRHIQKL